MIIINGDNTGGRNTSLMILHNDIDNGNGDDNNDNIKMIINGDNTGCGNTRLSYDTSQ
jgi:hypothetical protein